jgi:uracil-DNA glycosylase
MGMPLAQIKEARTCRVCAPHLPLGPRPVFLVGAGARLLIVGQAPGRRASAGACGRYNSRPP